MFGDFYVGLRSALRLNLDPLTVSQISSEPSSSTSSV